MATQPIQFYRKLNPNTNVNDFYRLDNNQYIGATQFGTGSGFQEVSAPKVEAPIDSNNLKSSNNLNLSSGNTFNDYTKDYTSNLNSFISGTGDTSKSITDFLKSYNQQTTPLETERTSLKDRLKSAYDKLGGVGTRVQEELGKFGYEQNVKQLQELNTQIASKQNEFARAAEDIRVNPEITTSTGVGRQAQLERQRAIELGSLSTTAQALQGNISLAMDTANQTVQIEFAPLEQEIASLQAQLTSNYDDLSRADKKRAEELSLILSERAANIANAKEEKKQIYDVMISAAQNGADNVTLNNIRNSQNIESAIQNAGRFLQAEQKPTTITVDGEEVDVRYNPETGEYERIEIPIVESENYFTDANGTSWNISGWATDKTKKDQMQNIANRVGKVTDENIDEKVSEFAPGLTSDMIRTTSERTGISWEALLTMIKQESTVGNNLSPVARKNNNFGGLTWSEGTQWANEPYNGVKGTARPEGGNYIKFPTQQAGLDAMGALMAQYGNVEPTEQMTNPEVDYYVKEINKGNIKINNVPEDMRGKVASALMGTKTESEIIKEIETQNKISLIKDIEDHSGLNSSVGPIALTRMVIGDALGNKQDFIGKVQQLVDDLTLRKLIEVKGQGATFGALSDSERAVIERAATPINQWAIKKKNKKTGEVEIKGYDISEKKFKEELEKIKNFYNQQSSSPLGIQEMEDGTQWIRNEDGTYTQINN